LTRLFANDDGILSNNEAGRLQAFNGNTLVDELVFKGDNVNGQKLVTLDAPKGFDSLVFSAGAYDSQNQFVAGAYKNDDDFTSAPYTAGNSLHGSDYLIDTILIGVKPAEVLV